MTGPIAKLGGQFFVMSMLSCCVAAQSQKEGATNALAVRFAEGVVHGFLVLRNAEAEIIATGELTQTARNGRVTSKTVFHFKDGSLHEETVVFSQRYRFRVLSYQLSQKGPAFKHPIDFSLDGDSGDVTVHYIDDDGTQKEAESHFRLPQDLVNGMIPTALKNMQAGAAQLTASLLAATPKPRLVKLEMKVAGKDAFSVGGVTREATKYVVKVEIGGVAGVVAPLVGKQPPDSNVWILEGDAPTFVKSEGPLYDGGPIWRIELVSPAWP